MHILFDKRSVAGREDHRVEVSGRIREEYESEKEYYACHGKELSNLSGNIIDRPSPDFLNRHRE